MTASVAASETGRVITGAACVAEGAAWLAQAEPRFAAILPALQPLPLRLKPDGFAALLGAIIGQQVSVASANAIWGRMQAAGLDQAANVAAQSEDDLRAIGLSRQKARYTLALARAGLDFDALRHLPDAAVIATLTKLPGIGLWTAEVYAMLSLGRADVFAPGDLALQEGVRMIFDLPERPSETALRAQAMAWSPWRSVAARLIWAYYSANKQREGMR